MSASFLIRGTTPAIILGLADPNASNITTSAPAHKIAYNPQRTPSDINSGVAGFHFLVRIRKNHIHMKMAIGGTR